MLRVITLTVASLAVAALAHARSPHDALKLPRATGKTVTVSDVEALYRAVASLESNTTIVLRKGTYELHRPIHLSQEGLRNIAIRGDTGNFQDVIVRGAGMNNKDIYHGVLAEGVERLLLADMTIGWVGYHPIALNGSCRAVHVYHCRLVDAGEQFIKASSDGERGGVDDGVVEYCVLEYTKNGPANGYTNGVDVHGGKKWIIRHNLFRNIRTPAGAKYKHVPAVLMWNGAKHTVCEANTFVNCDRAIAFGLVRRDGFLDHEGGIIRNNFIFVGKGEVPHADTGIFVASPRTKVLHNTIVLSGSYANAIETRWESTANVQVFNNLTDADILARSGAKMLKRGNILRANLKAFEDTSTGDLHITPDVVVDVKSLRDCPLDWDGQSRNSPQTTAGADEPLSDQ